MTAKKTTDLFGARGSLPSPQYWHVARLDEHAFIWGQYFLNCIIRDLGISGENAGSDADARRHHPSVFFYQPPQIKKSPRCAKAQRGLSPAT